MRRLLLALSLTAACLAFGAGCQTMNRCNCDPGCDPCGGGSYYGAGGLLKGVYARHQEKKMDVGEVYGPPVPTYGYPYYTTRAPRDFLVDNPPSIGP